MKYIDADLLIRKIKYQIHLENLNFAALGGGGQTFCTNTLEWVLKQIDSLQQEQPRVNLEKEIEIYLEPIQAWQVQEAPFTSLENCARHFCEVGLRRAAEMYDEIEYNRQRAEEE